MRLICNSFIIPIAALLTFGCTSQTDTVNDNSSKKINLDKIIEMDEETRLNTFAFNIYKNISETEDANIIISPYSISTAMAMAYGGSAGDTKDQISKTLFFEPDLGSFHEGFSNGIERIGSLSGEDMELNIANGMWLQHDYPFHEKYIKTIKDYYGSLLHKADFVADYDKERIKINQWVEQKTNDKIEELISEGILDEDTRLVLVNAIYFLSNWLHEFDESLTSEREFYPDSESEVLTPFMKKVRNYGYYEDDNAQVIRIPYKGNNFSMLVMLPKENIDIDTFEQELDVKLFENYVNNIKSHRVELLLPKFKIEHKANLRNHLMQMGMPLAFTDEADFSRMAEYDNLKIDEVIHQAFVEIDEHGTEAAAATAVTMMLKSTGPVNDVKVFDAKRPFLFVIKEDKKNTILFIGKVKNPAL